MASPLLYGKLIAAGVLLGGAFYLGYGLASGNAAKRHARELENKQAEFKKKVDAANERAEMAEAARAAVALAAENERAAMSTRFSQLQREAANAQLRRVVVNGKAVALDPYPFNDEFVRLLDDAARSTGGTRDRPEGPGGVPR